MLREGLLPSDAHRYNVSTAPYRLLGQNFLTAVSFLRNLPGMSLRFMLLPCPVAPISLLESPLSVVAKRYLFRGSKTYASVNSPRGLNRRNPTQFILRTSPQRVYGMANGPPTGPYSTSPYNPLKPSIHLHFASIIVTAAIS
jgi:hypothetical protein